MDDRALAVARENAKRNKIDHVARFEKFDLFAFDESEESKEDLRRRIGRSADEGAGKDGAALGEGYGFDMVVSNPPYVSSEDMRKVEKTWHEGKFALQGKLRGRGGSGAREDAASNGIANGNWNGHADDKSNGDNQPVGDEEVMDGDDGYSFYRRIKDVYSTFLDESLLKTADPSVGQKLPKLVLEVGATQSKPVQEMYASEGRLEIQRETARRREIGAPKLEEGDMVGTERSVWVYRL